MNVAGEAKEKVDSSLSTALRALFVFLLLFGLYCSLASEKSFSSKGESREGLVVKDMFEQQNFVLPLRNGVDIPSKPPLFHWLGAFSITTLQLPAELAIRLPSVFSAAFILMLFFFFVGQRSSHRLAALAVIICATTFEWGRGAVLARVDMLFSALLAASFMLFARFLATDDERRWRGTLYVIGGFLGFAVLTKGPIGLVLPWLAFVPTWVLFRGQKLIRADRGQFMEEIRLFAVSVAISIGIGLCWYVPAFFQGGAAFVDTHLFKENLARLLHHPGYDIGHEAPFYMTFVELISGFMPWSFLLPIVVLWLRREWSSVRSDPTIILSCCWLGVFLLIFSISESKRPVYLLPAYLPLSLLLAHAVSSHAQSPADGWVRRSFRWFAMGILIICGAVGVSLILAAALPARWFLSASDVLLWLDAVRANLLSRWWILLAGVGSAWIADRAFQAVRNAEIERGLLGCGVAGLLTVCVIGLGVVSPVSRVNSPEPFAAEMETLVPEAALLVQFRHDFYPLLFSASRNIPRVLDESMPNGEFFVVSARRDLDELRALVDQFELILQSTGPQAEGRDGLVLVRAERHARAALDSASNSAPVLPAPVP
ncbi:MAG: glycosyltransferase family 39 protein [Deltaproteobacteria bacterium]|nr:glycosyltransferase family 39 protein [Deltaproteobacteria bacterium]